jgi:predicted nucleic acid-binding protein
MPVPCSQLLSEDLQPSRSYGDVQVINPMKG